jgi:uncharacterized low-complexity protein
MKSISALLSAFVIATQLLALNAFTFKLINKTGSDIYVYTSAHDGNCGDNFVGTCDSEELKVSKDGTYTSPYTLRVDQAGLAMKAAWAPHKNPYGPNYQVECSKKDGVLWYNYSHVEGNVFHDVMRTLGGGQCPALHCNAGDDGCDWYKCGQGDCNVQQCSPIPGELVAVIGQ